MLSLGCAQHSKPSLPRLVNHGGLLRVPLGRPLRAALLHRPCAFFFGMHSFHRCMLPLGSQLSSSASLMPRMTHLICVSHAQVGLDFYESQMVGTLPPGLSNDVSYRGDAFTYETGEALLGKGFGDVTGGWCTGDQVGTSLPLPHPLTQSSVVCMSPLVQVQDVKVL